ncbi:MAG: cyclase family protein, partial [Clostridiales Family XIII bacterium]|nr:cyclase family protein [Clostridiales Family XIII bacterium]
ILLIYTSYCEKTHRPTRRDLVYSPLDADAVRWIVRKRVKSLGIDVPSIDINGDHTFPAHFAARQNGLIHMKNLIHMRPLVNKRFQFIGIPLKIVGGSGSPIRAVAVVEDEDCVRNSEGENDDLLVAIKHSEEK